MGLYDLTLSRRDHNHMTGFVIKIMSTVVNAKSLRECTYYIVLVVQALA